MSHALAREAVRRATPSMGLCLAGALAWLAGVAWQIGEPALWPARAYQIGLVLGPLLGALAWRLTHVRRPAWLASGCASALLCLALAAMAWGSTGWRAVRAMGAAWPAAWQGKDVPLCAQVEGLPQALDGGGVMFDAQLLSVGDAACTANAAGHQTPPVPRVSLRAQGGDGLGGVSAGQAWRLVARLHRPDSLVNPGGFDATLAPFERGVRALGNVRAKAMQPVLLRAAPPWPWVGLIDRTRQRVRQAIAATVNDQRAAAVLAGLAVGDQSGIDRDDWTVFRRTGVAHLVSISGTHIAMLGWLAAWLVRPLWARWAWGTSRWPAPEAARWAAVATSLLYAALAGWGVPAQRTVLMMAMMAWLHSGTRRWPWPMVWLASALVVVWLDPWALRQAGFWLSYVAVGVLMSSGSAQGEAARLAAPQIEPPEAGQAPLERSRWHRWGSAAWQATQGAVREMAHTQWLVTLALTPLALVCFQQVSVVGLFANFVAIPVFTLGITPLALAGSLCPPLWQAGAWLVREAMVWLSALSSWSWAVWQGAALPWWVAGGAIVGAFALVLPVPARWRAVALPFFLPLWCLPATWQLVPPPRPGQFSVLAADVGQGTAVLVRTAHHALLFDTGPKVGTQSDTGERVLLPLLRAIGVNRLDTLLISHQDTDHVGGAASVVSGMAVAALLTSLDEAHPLRHQAVSTGQLVPHQACLAGQRWDWDGVRFAVLHPTAADYADRAHLPPNALSCVLKVQGLTEGAPSVLLTGDIEAAQEQALLDRAAASPQGLGALHSTVLLVPHHGSQTSSTQAFLQAVAPTDSVVQAGRRNRYGHPAPAVMARYQADGLRVHTTPDCGACLWSSHDAKARCWRDIAPHYWFPLDEAP